MSNLNALPRMPTSTSPKLRSGRSMPQWMNETHDRIGPKPPAAPPAFDERPPALPPKKNQPEPDYEIIEFSGQQYSNATPLRPKTPEVKRTDGLKCTLCGSPAPWVRCEQCGQQLFCASCDDMFHRHPKRQTHLRKAIEKIQTIKPPIPPKSEQVLSAPVPPPRRNKRGMPSPLPVRKEQVSGSMQRPPSPSPSLLERMGNMRRNHSNRPLPETPNQEPFRQTSSPRSSTPNGRSAFDSIQRQPSITLEKIKSKASATLDRMALLQQRYRQHQESMRNGKSEDLSNRRMSSASNFNGSQMEPMGRPPMAPTMRNMSTSVFNLNQIGHRQHHSGWTPNQMHQAQSVAHLNCMNCNVPNWNTGGHDEWADSSNFNGSNMSLNLPPSGYYPNQPPMHPPPTWINNWGHPQMYPYPMNPMMPMMNNGMMTTPHPIRSRAQSRATSRAGSPALSIKSRKSTKSIRSKRNSYAEREATDDEDSEDDHRSMRSQKSGLTNSQRRQRKTSSTSQSYDQEDESETLSHGNRRRNSQPTSRERRSGSKTIHNDWLPGRRQSIGVGHDRNDRSSRKTPSDSPMTQDSESEPGTRALVQAKIQEKMTKQMNEPQRPLKVQSSIEDDQDDHYPTATTIEPHPEPKPEDDIEFIDDAPMGPPPSAPDHEWECEFCTFVNEPNIKICAICCKTPTQVPSKAPKVEQQPSNVQAQSSKTSKVQQQQQQSDINSATKLVGAMKISPSEDDSEDPKAQKKKGHNLSFEDIWATIEHDINETAAATANKIHAVNNNRNQYTDDDRSSIKSHKISTGCGPSPPRDITRKMSTGTSPPPQNISTQTYEPIDSDMLSSNDGRSSRTQTRSYSIAGPGVLPRRNEQRTQSRQSLNSDCQSLPPTPPRRDTSPSGLNHKHNANVIDAETLAYLDRSMQYFKDLQMINKTDRYRSHNDLRRDDLYLPRRSSITDYLNFPRYNEIQQFDQYDGRRKDSTIKSSGIELVMLLREAEHYKFTAEELQAALKHCGDTHPITWLRENWSKLVQTVQTLATKYGQERKENTIGTISSIEAREALRIHKGNVWHAVTECIEQRQKKYHEIASRGNYSREDIVTALTAHHGNLELALVDLGKSQLKPFLMRIWGPPTGVENESGNSLGIAEGGGDDYSPKIG